MDTKCVIAGLVLLFAVPALAADSGVTNYFELWLSTVDTDDSAWQIDDDASRVTVEADFGSLWFLGGTGQQLWGEGTLQYGYEGGVLGTRKEDTTHFRDSTGTTRAIVDTRFYYVSGFLGGVVSVSPIRFVRMYVAAGPSVTWGYVDADDEEDAAPPAGDLAIDISEGTNDVSFEAYARAGIELVLDNGFTLGASVRYANNQFDFDEAGEIELDDTLWLLTVGTRL
jgi:Outer membrane protein beta-barrel domain